MRACVCEYQTEKSRQSELKREREREREREKGLRCRKIISQNWLFALNSTSHCGKKYRSNTFTGIGAELGQSWERWAGAGSIGPTLRALDRIGQLWANFESIGPDWAALWVLLFPRHFMVASILCNDDDGVGNDDGDDGDDGDDDDSDHGNNAHKG